MKHTYYIVASVLPTVMVVSVVIMLGVLGLIMIWETDALQFSRENYTRTRHADMESAYTLYRNNQAILDTLKNAKLQLYDSLPASEVAIFEREWGLYKIVTVECSARMRQCRLIGAERASDNNCTFYCSDSFSPLTISGKTTIQGVAMLTSKGIIYGQMQAIAFSGTELTHDNIKTSKPNLPKPAASCLSEIARLSSLSADIQLSSDSVYCSFHAPTPTIIEVGEHMHNCTMSGQIIVCADELYIDNSCQLRNIIIVARKVTIGEDVRSSMQLIIRDSVIVSDRAVLTYPSGIYCGKYAELGERCEINGYVVVYNNGKEDIRKPNYKQARTAKLRGLLYVDGVAQLQGIVSGAVYLNRSCYYTSQGYYKDFLYDASILKNPFTAFPLWIADANQKRKEVVCLD